MDFNRKNYRQRCMFNYYCLRVDNEFFVFLFFSETVVYVLCFLEVNI